MENIFAIKTDKTDFVFKLDFFESEDKIEVKAISSFDYMLEEISKYWSLPFKKGSYALECVFNENLDFEYYKTKPLFFENGLECNIEDKKNSWNCILVQRKYFQAAKMVFENKVLGINQGLRLLGVNI